MIAEQRPEGGSHPGRTSGVSVSGDKLKHTQVGVSGEAGSVASVEGRSSESGGDEAREGTRAGGVET